MVWSGGADLVLTALYLGEGDSLGVPVHYCCKKNTVGIK